MEVAPKINQGPPRGTLILEKEVNLLPNRGYFSERGRVFFSVRFLKKLLEWVQNGLSTPLSEWSLTM